MGDHRLRAAIFDELRIRGASETYAIANALRMSWDGAPAAYPAAATPVVRRELQRMEREGIVARVPSRYRVHIRWGLTAGRPEWPAIEEDTRTLAELKVVDTSDWRRWERLVKRGFAVPGPPGPRGETRPYYITDAGRAAALAGGE